MLLKIIECLFFHKNKLHIDSILHQAIKSGLIKKSLCGYKITKYGLENGCCKTKNGDIWFSGKSVVFNKDYSIEENILQEKYEEKKA